MELRHSLENIAAEEELFGVINERLTALRQIYPSHRTLFTPSDIEFLIVNRLNHARGALDRF